MPQTLSHPNFVAHFGIGPASTSRPKYAHLGDISRPALFGNAARRYQHQWQVVTALCQYSVVLRQRIFFGRISTFLDHMDKLWVQPSGSMELIEAPTAARSAPITESRAWL